MPPKTRNNPKIYNCKECNYKSSKHSDYIKHCKTVKHLSRLTTDIQPEKSPTIHVCSCGKEYNHRASLWNHKHKYEWEIQHNFLFVTYFLKCNVKLYHF